jgi:hypothetical protein
MPHVMFFALKYVLYFPISNSSVGIATGYDSSVGIATGYDSSVGIATGYDSSVGIATGYGLDGPRIESRWGRDFPQPFRSIPGPT